jgi:hypothetical protein
MKETVKHHLAFLYGETAASGLRKAIKILVDKCAKIVQRRCPRRKVS